MSLINKIKFPNTLAFRLTLWYASTFFIVSLIAFLVLYLSISSIFSFEMDEDLIEDATEFKLLYQSEGLGRIKNEISREVNSDDPHEIFIRLLNTDGKLLYSSDLSYWPELTTDPNFHRVPSSDRPILATAEFKNQEYPIRMVYGLLDNNMIIHIGESEEAKEDIMELLFLVISILLCLLIPTVSFIGWFMAKQAVSGIVEVSRAAIDIKQGEYTRRVSIKSRGDEVQQLANTFNSMAERIRILIAEMREMTDNIAHDLRSPLARIRVISEGVLSAKENAKDCDKAASDTLEECDRLIHLINTTLDVSEAEAGIVNHKKESVDLLDITKDACELFEPVAEQKGIKLATSLEPVCLLSGNRQNLQRMLVNLLDNALKYTPKNGSVYIHLSENKKQIHIAITDSGIGIPESDQQRIFDRFFRCDQSRSQEGCGLGLSFARAVAYAHGGQICVNSILSQTSTFTIILPVSN